MLVALSQIKETGDATKLSTVQADLRKQGEKCLNDIVKDLHCALAPYSGANTPAFTHPATPPPYTSNEIQFCKVAGYDAANTLPTLWADIRGNAGVDAPGVVAGTPATGKPLANNATMLFDYRAVTKVVSPGDPPASNLVFSYGPGPFNASWQTAGTTQQLVLCTELAAFGDSMPDPTAVGGITLVDGFTVSWTDAAAPTVALLTAATPSPFPDKPIALTIKLVLKRRLSGKTAPGVNDQFAWTTVQTTVMLRPDENY